MNALRADAARNLERVLDAATEVFAASGPDASIDEIARRAGVGHATVFRRFPTKDDLMLAVIARRMAEIRGLAEEALAAADAGEAFFTFVRRVAELHARAPGLHRCVARCDDKPGGVELERLATTIVARAQRAGTVRADIEPGDVAPLVRAALLAAPAGQRERYLDIVLDGLRAGSA